MNLTPHLPQLEHILAIAERVNNKYPNAKGKCEFIADDLMKALSAAGIRATHIVGNFYLDEPASFEYVSPDEALGVDEYAVDHDWVEVEGKILDPSCRQFRQYVHEPIPDIAFLSYSDSLSNRYEPIEKAHE